MESSSGEHGGTRRAQPAGAVGGPIGTTLWLVILAATIVIPLVIAPTDIDAFRIPKKLLYQGVAAVCAALLGVALIYRPANVIEVLRRHLVELMVVAAAVVWTAITTLTSTNVRLSALSLIWVVSAAVMFVATLAVARLRTGQMFLAGIYIAASINAGLAMLQRINVYNPLIFGGGVPDRLKTTALVGNPNDVGTYLLFPALAAVVTALVTRGRRAVFFAAIAFLFAAGIAATATLTAIAAYLAAATVLLCLRTRRIVASISVAAVFALILFLAVAPLRLRAIEFATNAREGNYVALLSMRVPAYSAALEMFKDHPIVGVGPGCFGWWYLPYKLELNERYPSFFGAAGNFGEAHNDHLQTLAVSGLPGYAIFAAALVLLGRTSFRRDPYPASEQMAFSRLASLPMAVAFAVVALAQFPLELTSATSVVLHLAAICRVWSVE